MLADNHDGSEESDAAMAVFPCESDADCSDLVMVCVEGFCALDGSAPACTVDGDCLETDHCVWGNCETKGFYCMTDADCGDYMMCAQGGGSGQTSSGSGASSGSAGTPNAEPVDPDGDDSGGADVPDSEGFPGDCLSDDECDEGSACTDGFCQPADGGIEPPPETESWGRCTVDWESIPEDATCIAVCEAVSGCEGDGSVTVSTDDEGSDDGDSFDAEVPDRSDPPPEGEGSEEAPPLDPPSNCEIDDDCSEGEICMENLCMRETGGGGRMPEPDGEEALAMCTASCSYAMLMGEGVDELAALSQCIEDNADDDPCVVVEACDDAGEAFGEAVDAAGIGDSMGGGSEPTTGDGTGGTDGAPSGDNGAESGGDSSGGCGAGHSPALPWMVLMVVGLAALLRRRQTAWRPTTVMISRPGLSPVGCGERASLRSVV